MTACLCERPPAVPGRNGVHAALTGCVDALEQCGLIATRLTAAQWSAPGLLGASSIGAHLRHCLEHFLCLLDGLAGGVVDYDGRARDRRLESAPDFFESRRRALLRELDALTAEPANRHLRIAQTIGPDGEKQVHTSTLARELTFLSNHTLHHLAMARMLAAAAGVELPATLGVAFSTLQYERGRA